MQLLKLSFDHLPSPSTKKCYAYCCFFGKGCNMNRKTLIHLWMAEGFLQASFNNEILEDIGNKHFNILLDSSLLEEERMYNPYLDEDTRYCKMHDLCMILQNQYQDLTV
ncbi:hypothetical protein ACH5RR_021645 [Cinchona calisaya]|uniref:Disease resistance protein winged helix domain-containing protein n=1 Tax=Cinchona calisaya TaxID=153742 RepID=A0ABD2ZJN6_9GENT